MTTTASDTPVPAAQSRLEHFPVAFFSSVMGLAGLTIASFKVEAALGLPPALPAAFALATLAAFLVIAVFYAVKAASHPGAVVAEFNHPVKLHFFPTISISIILLAIVALHYAPAVAHVLFVIGVPLHLAFTLAVLNYWFNRRHFETVHLNPAWFIPIVGNVLVPIPGVALGYVEVSWFFYAIGIVFWIALFAIIINRVVFHNPLPDRLAPTMFILLAPPAVGFLSYIRLTDSLDPFARILFAFGLFLTLFLVTQVPRLARLPFFLSWWAYSFPLAAMTIASWVMHEKTGNGGYFAIAATLSAILALVIAMLVGQTLAAIRARKVCVPE